MYKSGIAIGDPPAPVAPAILAQCAADNGWGVVHGDPGFYDQVFVHEDDVILVRYTDGRVTTTVGQVAGSYFCRDGSATHPVPLTLVAEIFKTHIVR